MKRDVSADNEHSGHRRLGGVAACVGQMDVAQQMAAVMRQAHVHRHWPRPR